MRFLGGRFLLVTLVVAACGNTAGRLRPGNVVTRQLLLKLSVWRLGASVPGLAWHSRSIPGLLG